MRWAYVAAGALSVLLIMKNVVEDNHDRELMLAAVPPPDEVTLYTDFNSGSYFLIDGYKIYYDARPELYNKLIAGDKAFWDEIYATWEGNIDFGEFIEGYGFTWFAATKDSPMDNYLKSTPGYELVFDNTTDNIAIYKLA